MHISSFQTSECLNTIITAVGDNNGKHLLMFSFHIQSEHEMERTKDYA